jgi:hypothetical protein
MGQSYMCGRTSVVDDRADHPTTLAMLNIVDQVNAVIREGSGFVFLLLLKAVDLCFCYCSKLDISYWAIYLSIHDTLKYHKVYAV